MNDDLYTTARIYSKIRLRLVVLIHRVLSMSVFIDICLVNIHRGLSRSTFMEVRIRTFLSRSTFIEFCLAHYSWTFCLGKQAVHVCAFIQTRIELSKPLLFDILCD